MDKRTSKSDLDCLIPPEIKNDNFYAAIQQIVREEDIKTILEIGSSSGEGSTEAFVQGIRDNPNQPTLFCLEVSKPRFAALQNRYAKNSFVKCYNLSSISLEQFPDEKDIVDFYNTKKTALNNYPIERVLGWLQQDVEYIRTARIQEKGINKIKQENNIDIFDVVLIDGSEFTGNIELNEIYGAKYIFLDDINSYKNHKSFHRLIEDYNYTLIGGSFQIRNGYAIFKKTTVQPISYTTIQSTVEAIEGFMIPGQEAYLFNKVKSLPDDAVIVEIGSYKGRSTVAMAMACIGTKRKIYCIDTWNGNDRDFSDREFFGVWQQNIKKNGVDQYVVPVQGFSHGILKRWHELTNTREVDFIFIDGSHQYLDVLQDFQLSFPLVRNGGWIAFHDVIHTWPGSEKVWHKIAKYYLVSHEYSSSLACGKKDNSLVIASFQLPIHFFTIVLNGEPFIRYHIEVFKQLPFPWHWHIVEGVADLKHDTAWSSKLGGHISDEIHRDGYSKDGTTDYLDELVREYPDNVTVYRKPEGIFWDGKREMVNAPLTNIHDECLLWQIDVDELWTVEQLCTGRHLFISNPEKTAGFYWCWYFVGENLVISTRNCYAQNPQQDWLRTWRFKPGMIWAAHEPPVLIEPLPDNQWRNVAEINPFLHEETEEQGLVFQHFAYATSAQLQFKEQYYGYKNAVSQWIALQEQAKFPVLLRQYFPWVQDGTMVDTVESCGIIPIARKEQDDSVWKFFQVEQFQKPVKIKPVIVIDGVFFQIYKTGIARVWKSLLEEWAGSDVAKHIIVLDRAKTVPEIPGIRYRLIPPYDYQSTDADREMLQQICDQEGADLFISTYYTTPLSTPSVFMAYDMIPEVLGWDMKNPMWREKHRAIQQASAYLAISENTARDLVRFFPDISPELVRVAACGVQRSFSPANLAEVNSFRTKYGISKPYFLLVGTGGGYKNTILFFQAFAQLYSKQGFDIVCTGSGSLLSPELRAYTAGSVVHMLQLSDEELRAAYSGAVSLVYPSKYEGFGLPILEAMACGCPVITCANASIPEVAGEAVLYVNDTDSNELTNALCDVQKPDVRNSLVAAGLAQAKTFSWSKMAKIVSTALVDATLLPLNLRDINLIIFPDWSQSEESLGIELEQVIRAIATHPDRMHITLLIDTNNISQEEANLFLSGVAMNLLMQEDLDVTEGAELSLVGNLGEMQWKSLLPHLHARIILENENPEAIAQANVDALQSYELNRFSDREVGSFFLS